MWHSRFEQTIVAEYDYAPPSDKGSGDDRYSQEGVDYIGVGVALGGEGRLNENRFADLVVV